LLVTGSRDWKDDRIIKNAMLDARDRLGVMNSEITLVHGGATGADSLAADWAYVLGWEIEPYPLGKKDWHEQGKKAGPLRNKRMVDSGIDACLAFILNNSRGGSQCLGLVKAKGIPWTAYHSDGRTVVVHTSDTMG